MKSIQSPIIGIMAAFGSGILVLSALSFGLLEGSMIPQQKPTLRPTFPPPNLTPIGFYTKTATSSPTDIPATQTICPIPEGWEQFTIQSADQIPDLALARGFTMDEILRSNCLISDKITAGIAIYIPPLPTSTMTLSLTHTVTASQTPRPVLCGPPPGWVRYTIQSSDTLTKISRLYRVSVWQLRQANCLVSNLIRAGSRIWVPNVATSTYTFTPELPQPPTLSPSITPTPTPIHTLTPTITHSVTSTHTLTLTLTLTNTPTVTATSTSTMTATLTETPTPSPMPTYTQTPSDTPATP